MTFEHDAYDDQLATLNLDDLPLEDRTDIASRLDFLAAAEDAMDTAEDEASFRDAVFGLRGAQMDVGALC